MALRVLRRRFLRLAAGAVALPAAWRVAQAEAYPSRPVRFIVGLAAGTGADILARLLAQSLSERLGQPFVVENRSGAGGNIGVETVVNATPDGYTLLLVSTVNAVNASLHSDLPFDIRRDIAPVAAVNRVPNVVIVNPSLPVTTIPEFIAYAKANPGKINMGSVGNGTASHMAGELFKMMAGVNMVHVPYRGDVMPGLLGGEVQVVFAALSAVIGYIRAGQVRALAVTTAKRSQALPELPTVAEFVPGYEASTWGGIGAPKNTPVEIVNKLNADINGAAGDPQLKARLVDLGSELIPMSPAGFGDFIGSEIEKWAKVATFANVKVD
jgi:tripartite-type tricarboxylate transporter receptor subunit TctC